MIQCERVFIVEIERPISRFACLDPAFNPYDIPCIIDNTVWFTFQVIANGLDNKMREDMERMKKIRLHRGLRHYWGLRVRGQHTKTTGRRGRTVGVSKKK